MKTLAKHCAQAAMAALFVSALLTSVFAAGEGNYLSPAAMVATKDGATLYIACQTANRVLRFDVQKRQVVSSVAVPSPSTGVTLSADGGMLYVTCASPEGVVCIIDTKREKIVGQIDVGHTPMAPVISPDGKTLFVCNRFNDDVSVIDLQAKKEKGRIAVKRQPVAAALTKDGKTLLVANLLPATSADGDYVAAVVSVIDVASGKVAKELQLINGSGALNDLRVSPDGKYAAVTHVLARFHLPASQVDRGWMNANALTIIDLGSLEIVNTVLLDNAESGAANPWGAGWSSDGAKLVVAHSGCHEISVIDFPALITRFNKLPLALQPALAGGNYDMASDIKEAASHDLTFLVGARQRIKLGDEKGPRALVVVGNTAWVANYFSDTLSAVNLASDRPLAESVLLGAKVVPDIVRKGEMYFYDASLCFQTWQSCSSCHPGEGRVDALNWDLLNDGIGNPKNTKSLLLAHKTPPTMSLGIRDTAEVAVRSGIKFVLFSQQTEEVPVAIDEYLKTLKPVPSPRLVKGKLSEKALLGQTIFKRAGCIDCHPAGLYTDLQNYDVGTQGKYDKPTDKFDTPTLVEIWRTAPYLHDGSALTVRDVVTGRNLRDQHGKTSNLTPAEIDELCEFLLSL